MAIRLAFALMSFGALAMAHSLIYSNFTMPREAYEALGDDGINDLRGLAFEYCKQMCIHEFGRDPSCCQWADITGNHGKIWSDKRIDILSTSDLVYTDIETGPEKPAYTFFERSCNPSDASIQIALLQGVEISSTFQWSVTWGISSTTSIEMSVGVPDISQTKYSESITLSFSKTETQSTTNTRTIGTTHTITIPPQHFIKATLDVIETDVSARWTADIKMTGYAVLGLDLGGGATTLAPVTSMYGNIPGFNCWCEATEEHGFCTAPFCTAKASGVYTGVWGQKDYLNIEQFDECPHQSDETQDKPFLQYI